MGCPYHIETAVPAFRRLQAYFDTDYLPHARDSIAATALRTPGTRSFVAAGRLLGVSASAVGKSVATVLPFESASAETSASFKCVQ